MNSIRPSLRSKTPSLSRTAQICRFGLTAWLAASSFLLAHADDATQKDIAEARRLSGSTNVKDVDAGDNKFAEIRARQGIELADMIQTWIQQGDIKKSKNDPVTAIHCYNAAIAADPKATPESLAVIQLRLAAVYQQQNRQSDALAMARAALKARANLDGAATIVASALEAQNQRTEALAFLGDYVKTQKDLAPAIRYRLVAQGAKMRIASNEPTEALAILDELLAYCAQHMDIPELAAKPSELRLQKFEILLKSGDTEKAILTLRDGLKSAPTECNLYYGLLAATPSEKIAQSMLVELHANQLANWGNQAIYDSTQSNIVQTNLLLKLPDQALSEARCYYLLCNSNNLAGAAWLVATCLKAKDGDLLRANQFLRFVRFGAAGEDAKIGTGDDIIDPCAGLTPVIDETLKGQLNGMVDGSGANWSDLLDRARLQVALGKYDLAVTDYRAGFAASPGNQKETQFAADALANFVGRLSRNEALVQQLMAYLMYGPNGVDGKLKTADDLADPSVSLEALFKPRAGN